MPRTKFVEQDEASALRTRRLEILRLASQLPPGPLRRDALAEVNRLRLRTIELQHQAAAGLKAKIAAHTDQRVA